MADKYTPKVPADLADGDARVLSPLTAKKGVRFGNMDPSMDVQRNSSKVQFTTNSFHEIPRSSVVSLTGNSSSPTKDNLRRRQSQHRKSHKHHHHRFSTLEVKMSSVDARQSVALFANKSYMIKPSAAISKETDDRLSTHHHRASQFAGRGPSKGIGAGDLKRFQTTRASIFTRMADEKAEALQNCGPWGSWVLEGVYRFLDFWEYYLGMTAVYLVAMFTVFNPFSKEICGDFPCFPGAALGLSWYQAVFLLVAKWTAAALYVLFAEVAFIYSRISLGFLQMSPLHQYIPYVRGGNYHGAHALRGWAFVTCALVHTFSHFLRWAFSCPAMATQLWVSGFTLLVSLTLISVLACRDVNIPFLAKTNRWARQFLRKNVKWETMRGMHVLGVVAMALSAWWHRFPEGTSPTAVWFPNRFFTLFMSCNAFYLCSRWANWIWTVQVDIVAHTIYKSCQLVVIKNFPYAKSFCNHGRSWFSADAKVMFPDVDNREWHPFTCVVNSNTGTGYILIKSYGDWSDRFCQVPASFLYMRTPCIKMSTDISPKHQRVLIITSGTFITTVAGTVAQGVSLSENDSHASQEITIVWIDREPIMIALVCLRMLSCFSMTDFRIYCTAKETKLAAHLDEIQIMSTMSSNLVDDEQKTSSKTGVENHASALPLISEDEPETSGLDKSPKSSCKEQQVHNVLMRAQTNYLTKSKGDKGEDDVITMLQNLTEEYDHIEIEGGRPDMEALFDEYDPGFVFIGAAPPVAAGVIKIANERNIEWNTSSYL